MKIAVAFGLTIAFFWPTVASFPATWERYGMSHGWLLAGLVCWLVWRDRDELLRGRGGDPLLLLPLAALSTMWLVAVVSHIQLVHQIVFVLLMVCWGLVVLGWSSGRSLIVLGATFLLGLPLWEGLVAVLRPLTTVASGSIVSLLGIPAEIEGDWIHIAAGSFIIEDGCAGLNYLLSALAIGAVYAHVLVRGWRAQLAVLAAAAAFAILGNWVRVVALIVIGHVTEMQSGLMTSHHGFGWLVFTASLVPFFIVARRIEKRGSHRVAAAGVAQPGLDDEDIGEATAGTSDAPGRRGRLALASAVAVLGPVLYFTIGVLPPSEIDQPVLGGAPVGTGWSLATAADRPFAWRPSYQGADQHDALHFTDGGAHVVADRFVYRKQTQGAKLIGYPNRIAPASDILDQRVLGPVDPQGRRWVQQAVIRTPDGPVLTWYWYRVGGIEAFSRIHAKALEVPAFLTRRRASELIAFTAPCAPDGCANAFETLASFTGAPRAGDDAR